MNNNKLALTIIMNKDRLVVLQKNVFNQKASSDIKTDRIPFHFVLSLLKTALSKGIWLVIRDKLSFSYVINLNNTIIPPGIIVAAFSNNFDSNQD
jgi:hypothetical protein